MFCIFAVFEFVHYFNNKMETFNFDEFVEHWAEIYRPMQHLSGKRSKNKRFFLTDTYMGMSDFMTGIQPDKSPCVIMESNAEGELSEFFDMPEYTLYFMVRAEEMGDGASARNAKREAVTHMKKFMSYLKEKQRNEEHGITNIDTERVRYQTVGPMYDGWFGVTITLSDVQKLNGCVNSDDYIE